MTIIKNIPIISKDCSIVVCNFYTNYIYSSIDGGNNWVKNTSTGTQKWHQLSISDDGTKMISSNDGYSYKGVLL